MRLAIVSQQGRKASGAEHALVQFVERLPADIELIWFFFEDGEFAQTIRGRYRNVSIVQMSDRVANAQRGGLALDAVAGSARVAVQLARALKRARPDLVLTNSMKAHIVGSLAAKSVGLRCVNYVHDMVDGPALMLLRLISRFCAVARLTCSNAVKVHLALPRTNVVYAAIDVKHFAKLPDRASAQTRLGLPARNVPVVALVGRIARWKGQDRFIRIAASVLARFDAHFCIIGSPIFGCDAEYVDELRAQIERSGLADRVTFVPWQDDMRNVYAAIDVACNCSAREPFGRTSLEALASGVPIVCFDDAGICEVFDQDRGGTHVAAGDEDAFAAAIVRYLTHSPLTAKIREDARRAAGRMDIDAAYATFAAALGDSARRSIAGLPASPQLEQEASECLVV